MFDLRPDSATRVQALTGLERRICELCDGIQSRRSLIRRLADEGLRCSDGDVDPALSRLIADRVILSEGESLLLDRTATASQLADQLHIPRARVNFIISQMLHDGIVVLDSEKTDGVRVERVYRANVRTFELEANAESSLVERLQAANYLLDTTRQGLLRSITAHPTPVLMYQIRARIPTEKQREYMQRLAELQAAFDKEGGSAEDKWYTMVLALYPEVPASEED